MLFKLFIVFTFLTSFKVTDTNIEGVVCAKTQTSISVCAGKKQYKINEVALVPLFSIGDSVVMVIRDNEFNNLMKK